MEKRLKVVKVTKHRSKEKESILGKMDDPKQYP